MILILLTCKIGSSHNDSGFFLLLNEKGLHESALGMISMVMLPFNIWICVMVGYYLQNNSNELELFYKGIGLKYFSCFYGLLLLIYYPENNELTMNYYLLLFIENIISSIAMNCVFVSICGFFNKIADFSMAGSILTFLNTVHNVGGSLPRYFVYHAIDFLTLKEKCAEADCPNCKPECTPGMHGYYPLAVISLCFAVGYMLVLRKLIAKVNLFPKSSWFIEKTKEN